MTYMKQTWRDYDPTTPVSAARLGHIEDGIFNAGGGSSLFPVIAGNSAYVASTGLAGADTAALQAAHDAFGSNGGMIALDQGPYVLTGGGVNFTKPIHLLGTGPYGPNAAAGASYLTTGSVIDCASASLNALTVNADGFSGEKLAVLNTSVTTPTAGAGIQVATLGRSTRLVDCTIDGFYRDFDIVNGYEWYVSRCHFFDPVRDAIRIQDVTLPDGGDGIISDSFIISGPNNLTPNAGIEWNSGGGLKVAGTKINCRGTSQFTVGVDFAIADGATTSVGIVNGCSIENTTYGVIVQNQGPSNTGVFAKIVISSNEFFAAGGTGHDIAVVGGATGKISDITIADNICTGSLAGILLGNADKIRLRGNSGVLDINAGVTNLTISHLDYSFTTVGRPSATPMAAGSSYYDTTLHKPLFADGAGNWKDAAGSTV